MSKGGGNPSFRDRVMVRRNRGRRKSEWPPVRHVCSARQTAVVCSATESTSSPHEPRQFKRKTRAEKYSRFEDNVDSKWKVENSANVYRIEVDCRSRWHLWTVRRRKGYWTAEGWAHIIMVAVSGNAKYAAENSSWRNVDQSRAATCRSLPRWAMEETTTDRRTLCFRGGGGNRGEKMSNAERPGKLLEFSTRDLHNTYYCVFEFVFVKFARHAPTVWPVTLETRIIVIK